MQPDQVARVASSQELPAAHVGTPFDRFYDQLWGEICDLYAQKSGIPLEELTGIYEKERVRFHRQIEGDIAPVTAANGKIVDKSEILGKRGYPGGYYTTNDVFEAISTFYPDIWSLNFRQVWIEEGFLSTNMTVLDRLRRSYGLETNLGKYMAALFLIHQARTNAIDPLRKREKMLSLPIVSLTSPSVPKEQIPKLLDRTYPPKYLADQLGIATVSIAQELFGGDHLRAQLWKTLAYLDARIDFKGKLLEAILDGEKNRVYSPALNMISKHKHLIPDFAREELGLVS